MPGASARTPNGTLLSNSPSRHARRQGKFGRRVRRSASPAILRRGSSSCLRDDRDQSRLEFSCNIATRRCHEGVHDRWRRPKPQSTHRPVAECNICCSCVRGAPVRNQGHIERVLNNLVTLAKASDGMPKKDRLVVIPTTHPGQLAMHGLFAKKNRLRRPVCNLGGFGQKLAANDLAIPGIVRSRPCPSAADVRCELIISRWAWLERTSAWANVNGDAGFPILLVFVHYVLFEIGKSEYAHEPVWSRGPSFGSATGHK